MIRFLADVNFAVPILRGVRRLEPTFDVVRAQDVGLGEAEDPDVLAWAAEVGRVLLTQDVQTMIEFASQRLRAGLSMPGVFVVPQNLSVGVAVYELAVVAGTSDGYEWDGQIVFVPL